MNTLLQKFNLTALLVAGLLMNSHSASAQHGHSDIEFEYDGGMIEVEFGPEGRVFEADFPTSGTFEQNTEDPGFESHAPVNPFDEIDYNILGPLEYHDGDSFAAVPTGVSILIDDNPSGSLTVDSSTVGPASGGGIIGAADGSGVVHTHIDFTLQPGQFDVGNNPPAGAYALLMELTTDANGIANSDPFYIVFNWGLEEDENLPGPHFHDAVEAFAGQIPEPTSFALMATAAAFVGVSRRRVNVS